MRRRPDNNQPEYSIPIDQDGYPIEEEPEDLPEAQQERKKTGRFVRKLLLRLCIVGIILLMIEFAILLYSGQIWFNEPKKKDYPVRGPVMDVFKAEYPDVLPSCHQVHFICGRKL